MKASARKSHGEYKPLIVHDTGRTEIVGKNVRIQKVVPQTKFYDGPLEITHFQRGVTFYLRSDAIAYAQRVIDRRNEAHAKYMAEYEARQKRYAEQRAAS